MMVYEPGRSRALISRMRATPSSESGRWATCMVSFMELSSDSSTMSPLRAGPSFAESDRVSEAEPREEVSDGATQS